MFQLPKHEAILDTILDLIEIFIFQKLLRFLRKYPTMEGSEARFSVLSIGIPKSGVSAGRPERSALGFSPLGLQD